MQEAIAKRRAWAFIILVRICIRHSRQRLTFVFTVSYTIVLRNFEWQKHWFTRACPKKLLGNAFPQGRATTKGSVVDKGLSQHLKAIGGRKAKPRFPIPVHRQIVRHNFASTAKRSDTFGSTVYECRKKLRSSSTTSPTTRSRIAHDERPVSLQWHVLVDNSVV